MLAFRNATPGWKIHADDAASAGYASHIRNNREAMHPGSAAPFLPEADVLLQKVTFICHLNTMLIYRGGSMLDMLLGLQNSGFCLNLF